MIIYIGKYVHNSFNGYGIIIFDRFGVLREISFLFDPFT